MSPSILLGPPYEHLATIAMRIHRAGISIGYQGIKVIEGLSPILVWLQLRLCLQSPAATAAGWRAAESVARCGAGYPSQIRLILMTPNPQGVMKQQLSIPDPL